MEDALLRAGHAPGQVPLHHHEALRALPKESVREILERQLELPYQKMAAAQFLYLVDGHEVVDTWAVDLRGW